MSEKHDELTRLLRYAAVRLPLTLSTGKPGDFESDAENAGCAVRRALDLLRRAEPVRVEGVPSLGMLRHWIDSFERRHAEGETIVDYLHTRLDEYAALTREPPDGGGERCGAKIDRFTCTLPNGHESDHFDAHPTSTGGVGWPQWASGMGGR